MAHGSSSQQRYSLRSTPRRSCRLGSLQVEHGVGPHLRRLEYDDDETILPKLAHDRLLVTPARLDTNPADLVLHGSELRLTG